MTNEIKAYSFVKYGDISKSCRELITTAIKTLEGKTVVITIKEIKRKRSNYQNSYYWGVVIPPIQEVFIDAGNNVDSEDINTFLKGEVGKLTKYIKLPNGEFKHIQGSAKKLNTKEFEEYLEKIRAWAAENLGIIIPLPNEEMNIGELIHEK